MNKKGFAISVVLYTMVILVIGIFYLLLGIVRNRYTVGNDLKNTIINNVVPGGPPIGNVLADIVDRKYDITTPDENETKYLYGDVDNNYVWYSGKLWRIVCINEDRSIKIVTQGNMTNLSWSTSEQNTNYSISQVRTWLNNDFLPVLYDVDNLLVDREWDYTTYSSFPTEKLETTNSVTEKVGLLNVYDFMMTGGKPKTETPTETFLNNGYWWWMISPYTNNTYVWRITNHNNSPLAAATYRSPNFCLGIRPAVNLKPEIEIAGGDGTKTNPYLIEGDKSFGSNGETLNSRLSGEYIKFNDVLYRIVGIEEIDGQKLTKVTMADYSVNQNTLSSSVTFGESLIYSPTSGVGLYLEDWYKADSTSTTYASIYLKDNYKAMIATTSDYNILWYTGPSSGVGYNYTSSKKGTPVSANIGLGYYGEMFSSQFGENSDNSKDTWLLTINSSVRSHVYYISSGWGDPFLITYTSSIGVRPSFYLKPNVKILSGSGMPYDPYEISMN